MEEVVNIVNSNFGEINNLIIENNIVSFEVYRGDYEEAPKKIHSSSNKFHLKLIDKFDDPFFTLSYQIIKK